MIHLTSGPEHGYDLRLPRIPWLATQDLSGPLRASFIGRLVPYKGSDMLLEAAAPFLREGRPFLDIIGDGPIRASLEDQARTLGIAAQVTFHGMLPHRAVQDVAVRSNLLTFPSIREFGGGVVLEAMALGLVPVVVDYAGPGELVSDATGYRIPIGSRSQVILSLRDRLDRILSDPSDLPRLAASARSRVLEQFT